MEEKIIDILVRVCEDDSIKNNKEIDLIESGILDSLAFISLLEEIYEEFGVELQPTQIEPNVWRSVKSIKKVIEDNIEK
mgnify:CR=1 FL=1